MHSLILHVHETRASWHDLCGLNPQLESSSIPCDSRHCDSLFASTFECSLDIVDMRQMGRALLKSVGHLSIPFLSSVTMDSFHTLGVCFADAPPFSNMLLIASNITFFAGSGADLMNSYGT